MHTFTRTAKRLALYRELWSIHNIRWLFIARLLANIIFYSTVMVQYEASRGLNFTEMFALEAISSAAAWIFEIPTGIWADQSGYRRVLIIGYASNIASLLIFITTRGFWAFAFASVLFGLNLACLSGCEDALIYESLPGERAPELATSAFSLLSAGQSAGFLSGLALGSFLGMHDPALPFSISLLPLLLALMAILRLQTPSHVHVRKNGPRSRARVFWHSALQLLREQPRTIGLALFQSAAFALTNAIFWYNQPYFMRVGIAVAWFGPITATAVALGMFIVLTTPLLRRLLGTYGTLGLSCILPGTGFILLANRTTPLLTLLFIALIIAGSTWRQPVISSELNRRIADGSRVTALSVLSFIGTLAGAALNPLIGLAGDFGLGITGLCLGSGLIISGLLAIALNAYTDECR